jgi:hypothetical protein
MLLRRRLLRTTLLYRSFERLAQIAFTVATSRRCSNILQPNFRCILQDSTRSERRSALFGHRLPPEVSRKTNSNSLIVRSQIERTKSKLKTLFSHRHDRASLFSRRPLVRLQTFAYFVFICTICPPDHALSAPNRPKRSASALAQTHSPTKTRQFPLQKASYQSHLRLHARNKARRPPFYSNCTLSKSTSDLFLLDSQKNAIRSVINSFRFFRSQTGSTFIIKRTPESMC